MSKKGIDISKWQGTVDFQKVKNDGVSFAIIREGYGKKDPNQIDKKFYENYNNAKSAGIAVGVYHYSYASGINDAKEEAKFCLENIKNLQLEYPVCFDIEDKEQLKLSSRERTDICKAFCEEIESAGYYAMIYCNLNWWKNYLLREELEPKYDLWLAQWGTDSPDLSCGIWQKTSSGSISGINGNVDLNESFRDYPSIIKSKGLNGFKSEDAGSSLNQSKVMYTVKKGDTLWKISEKYLGNGSKYNQIKSANNLNSDTIYPGQNLVIPS